MEVISDIRSLRVVISDFKNQGKKIVLVPTMGALHDGHRSCVDAGRSVRDAVMVISIFVNPTQFGPGEDLDKYPRTLDADLELCEQWGCDVVFTPAPETMYASEPATWVVVEGITETMCGRSRPGHFRGVTTVVTKLFNIVRPDAAVFGQKDAQQALVIRKMVDQLDMAVDLIAAPIAREPGGLALSSRNRYLTDSERARAVSIYRALQDARERIRDGVRNPEEIAAGVTDDLAAAGVDQVEYVDISKADDLSPLAVIEGKVILAVAARVGSTRLIDNIVLRVEKNQAVEEVALF